MNNSDIVKKLETIPEEKPVIATVLENNVKPDGILDWNAVAAAVYNNDEIQIDTQRHLRSAKGLLRRVTRAVQK